MLELTININNWNVGDYRKFLKAVKENDFDVVLEKVAKMISTWNLPGDPTSLEYYDTLSMGTWRDIVKKVNEALTAEFDTKK